MRKTNLSTVLSDTIFCFYFIGLDRTLIYQERCLIMAFGKTAENSVILADDLDLSFEQFHEIAKKQFLILIDDLQGN